MLAFRLVTTRGSGSLHLPLARIKVIIKLPSQQPILIPLSNQLQMDSIGCYFKVRTPVFIVICKLSEVIITQLGIKTIDREDARAAVGSLPVIDLRCVRGEVAANQLFVQKYMAGEVHRI